MASPDSAAMAALNVDEWFDIGDEGITGKIDATSLYAQTQRTAAAILKNFPNSPIFKVDLNPADSSLSQRFLDMIPEALRQQMNCSACRQFMDRYGNLVLVSKDGTLLPLFWPAEPDADMFYNPIMVVRKLFGNKKVSTEFKYTTKKRHAGVRTCCKGTCSWKHMTFDFPESRANNEAKGFERASTADLVTMLERVLEDYDLGNVREAHQLLIENKLCYADNHKGAINWLLEIKESCRLEKVAEDTIKHNLTYHAAASSFTGCLKQLRSGALGTLLADIKDKKSFSQIQAQWNKINNSLSYMRPQAAPTVGNILSAERLFSQLGLTANDMRRAYLTTAGIPAAAFIYQEMKPVNAPVTDSIFAKIKPKIVPGKSSLNLDAPPTSMTFSNFVKKILRNAKKVEYNVPYRTNFFFLITGLPDTAPLMQWHNDSNRASWYTHGNPQRSVDLGLNEGWAKVSFIIPFPHLWDAIPATTTFPLSEDPAAFKYYHSKNGFRWLIGLDGIREKETDVGGLCLFPTLLKSEFHGVRSTIEAYSGKGRLERSDVEFVGGVEIDKSSSDKHLFQVTDRKGMCGRYEIVLFE